MLIRASMKNICFQVLVLGVHTSKVIDYDVAKKKCRQCDVSQRLGIQVKHDCRKNYFGSAKGMEAHSATKMFKRSKERGLQYKTLIGDDDASTIARLHKEVDESIEKVSDPTHTKRTLTGKLQAVKTKHRELTAKTISYVEGRNLGFKYTCLTSFRMAIC